MIALVRLKFHPPSGIFSINTTGRSMFLSMENPVKATTLNIRNQLF
ncbi:MAG: hypothetical protein L7W43_19265 [Rubripirellula sp.]|nr:hypothetical protein [Rubripirellula sp.]